MVINGGSRSGTAAYTSYLGAHLQRTDTNERVHVRELHGMAAVDLTDALREMSAVGEGSRSRLPLYHANIDWRHDERMTDAQKARAVERLAEELGLADQPRVVVEHVKEGREHLHVVWSRIDGETLRAIPDNHNYRRHEIVARELEREFEHARVQGAHYERDGADRPARCPTLGETRQAERSGMTPAEAKAQLRELWQSADSGQAFAAALDNAGWMLAQGDKRGFVALDPAGEVRAVNKDITGLTAARVRERLADIDPGHLPSVDAARDLQRARQLEAAPAASGQAAELEQPESVSPQHAASPQPAPVSSDEHDRDQAGELAAYAARQKAGFEEAQRIRAALQQAAPAPVQEAEPARQQSPRQDYLAGIMRARDLPRFADPAPEQVQPPAREPEREQVRERARETEPVAHGPETVRPSLFQTLTAAIRNWWHGPEPTPQPQPDLAADRRTDRAGDAQHVPIKPAPAQQPAPEPVNRQKAEPEPERHRPAERFVRRSIADEMLDQARADIAAERASETPQQRAERDRQERSYGDGSRERTRYHHRSLWELLNLLHPPPGTRHRNPSP